MKSKPFLVLAGCLLTLLSCGAGPDDPTMEGFEGVEATKQSLVVDDLYSKLREVENLLPQPLPVATVVVGTMNTNGGFSGLTSRYEIDPITRKPRLVPAITSIDGIEALLEFRAPAGVAMSVTANGITATSTNGVVRVNVGTAKLANWSFSAGGWTVSDKLNISRASVIGAGAFTVAALPISIVYEPPMNAARTNGASIGFRQEMTTITSVSKGQTNTATPKWATGIVMQSILDRLSKHWKPAAAVKSALSVGKTLIGTVDSSTTTGTTVNSDSTLGLSQVTAQTISTNAKLGPGKGDIVVFYKDARVVWGMENGDVTLTLIDHGPLAMVTVATLKNDLAAVNAGQIAPVTRLDAPTLTALITLDPLATLSTKPDIGGIITNAPTLAAPRFRKDTTLILSGSSFQNSISHTVTQTDKTSTLNTTTTVKNYHPGWLSLVGIGQTKAGTFTSTVSMGTSRTDAVSSTVSASFSLSAAAGESYSVDVHYDNIFGSFLTRFPPPPPIVVYGGIN